MVVSAASRCSSSCVISCKKWVRTNLGALGNTPPPNPSDPLSEMTENYRNSFWDCKKSYSLNHGSFLGFLPHHHPHEKNLQEYKSGKH